MVMDGLKLILAVSVAMMASSAAAEDQNAGSCSTSLDCVWSGIAGGKGGGGHWRCDKGTCVPIKVAAK